MKIAIASCAKIQDLAVQPAWDDIRARRPDVLLLLGDMVYLDRNDHDDPAALAAELRGLYQRQFAQPQFAALRADLQRRGGRLLAVYDDHDFVGDNRCGADAPPALREAARAEFVRAFAPPQTGDEVYAHVPLGLVDLVLLDARFHRQAAPRPADADAMLGAAQWAWLERTVADSRAPYLVVASSSTVHQFGGDSWERHPAAFQRLRRLLRPRRGALVVSGDVHHNDAYDDSGVVEIVSSAVARIGSVFGAERRNWGLLHFGPDRLMVQLHSLKAPGRLAFELPLAHWALP